MIRRPKREAATAFAPASVGNVGVGFDILGHALEAVGDTVTVRAVDDPGVKIDVISGTTADLPKDPENNTASVALLNMRDELGLGFGMSVSIEKGIPIGAGMGGSAASAVAAVVAANELLEQRLPPEQLLSFALAGEAKNSGSIHADNVAPCLYGGMVLAKPTMPPKVTSIPVPRQMRCVLVYPDLYVETRSARTMLAVHMRLSTVVAHTYNLAGFLAGCFNGDLELIKDGLKDLLVEPQRKHLIRGFDAVQKGALNAGALGCSISGSGPSVFAWCEQAKEERVAEAMLQAFASQGIETQHWISPVDSRGARLVEV